MSTLAAVVVDADDDAGDADSQLFFGAADVDAAVDENEFLLDDEDDDSSSDVGLDFEVSEAAVEEGVEVVSEIFPSEEDPAFQLGVCFFQAGWAASFGFSSTGARVDLFQLGVVVVVDVVDVVVVAELEDKDDFQDGTFGFSSVFDAVVVVDVDIDADVDEAELL